MTPFVAANVSFPDYGFTRASNFGSSWIQDCSSRFSTFCEETEFAFSVSSALGARLN
jgi:hypothetical protein